VNQLAHNNMRLIFNFVVKVFFLFLVAVVAGSAGCINRKGEADSSSESSRSAKGNAQLVFTEYEHDFGKVTQGEKVAYVFKFENKGTGDLIIKSATTTCGCTVPRYDKNPVKPGDTGTIEVEFNTAGREGIQTKMITVASNASIPEVLLRIRAEIVTSINNNN
jgi:hypothetical protein